MMDATRPERAGVDYTVQASVQVISSGLASIASGVSADLLGYPPHFALGAALSVIPVWLVFTWPKSAPPRFALR
jgi:PAT family beta-lactamase induction signal transducer AmpG